jgi:hypothetical protein
MWDLFDVAKKFVDYDVKGGDIYSVVIVNNIIFYKIN